MEDSTDLSLLLNHENFNGSVSDEGEELFLSELAERECNITSEHYQSITYSGNDTGLSCPGRFDGWGCWKQTPAGSIAFSSCPAFIEGFDPRRQAYIKCLDDGTWFRHPETNLTWANYTTCIDTDDLSSRENILLVYQVGYFVSLCALIPALIILSSVRRLQCTRVQIHKNLFSSFIISNILWITWNFILTQLYQYQLWCICLHVSVQYFLVANYFWMFCEGYYLNNLLSGGFNTEYPQLLNSFYIIGWLGPLLPVSLYTGFSFEERGSHECWINYSQWTLFLSVPVCISLVLNFAFFINVIRILVIQGVKRRNLSASATTQSPATEIPMSILRVFRVQLLSHLVKSPGFAFAIYYEYGLALCSSFQGLVVSLLFCYFDGEVKPELQKIGSNLYKLIPNYK